MEKYLDKHGRIYVWPKKRMNKVKVLQYMIQFFDFNKIYNEKEINQIINENHTFSDYFLIRRELIEHKLLIRTRDGRRYWRGDYIPRVFETERLIIRDSELGDELDLIKVNQSCSYLEEYTGIRHVDRYIKKILKGGDLPPSGHIEFYKVKSIVDKTNQKIIGFMEYYLGYPDSNTFWLATFYIDKEHQNKGYGSEVLESLYKELVKGTINKIELGVHLKNWQALRFWIKQQFCKIKRISGDKEYAKDHFSILVLERTIEHG